MCNIYTSYINIDTVANYLTVNNYISCSISFQYELALTIVVNMNKCRKKQINFSVVSWLTTGVIYLVG